MTIEEFDLGVIGCGPAGYTAALHAAKHGLKVIIFEKNEIGGICLNKGCIPTKSIMHASEMYYKLKHCENCGISAKEISLNWEQILERKNSTVLKLRKGLETAFKNAKITVLNAEAKIEDKNTIVASNNIFHCKKIICATGSSIKTLKGLEYDNNYILSSDDILEINNLPKSILIIGSGAIGIEWARIMSNFGIEVTIVEVAQHLLPLADVEISKRIERIFKSRNIKFYTNTSVQKIEDMNIILSNGDVLKSEKILVATGRIPNISEKIDGVSYLGDVAGEIQLAHYAIKQSIQEIDKIKFDKNLTPAVIYGTPEIAWVGKKEQDLEPETYKKSTILMSRLGKSHCDDETEGFIKLLIQEDKIVGAHIIACEASSMLQQVLIAMQNDITVEKLKEVCFAHPTYSEGIFEALFQ